MDKEPTLGDILATALGKPMTTDSQYEMIRDKMLKDRGLPSESLVDDLIGQNIAKIPVIKYLRDEYFLTLTDAKFYYEHRHSRLANIKRLQEELDRAKARAY